VRDNGCNSLVVNANGAFTFRTAIAGGGSYVDTNIKASPKIAPRILCESDRFISDFVKIQSIPKLNPLVVLWIFIYNCRAWIYGKRKIGMAWQA